MKGCANKKSSQNKRTKINACNLSFKLEVGTAVKFGGGGWVVGTLASIILVEKKWSVSDLLLESWYGIN